MEKRGPVRDKAPGEYHAGDPFGIVSDQPTILLAKSQGRSQYVVQSRDDVLPRSSANNTYLEAESFNVIYRSCVGKPLVVRQWSVLSFQLVTALV